jgi:hypothetical protein
MKIKLALVSLLIPTAVFAQAGNAGYQGTTSATQGLGASNPNAGGRQVARDQPYDSRPSSGTPQPIGTVGGPISPSQISGSGAPTAPISVGPSGQNPGGPVR